MQYEYKILPVTNDEVSKFCEGLTDKLNQVGKERWELVSIISKNSLGSSSYNIFGITQKQFLVLKREIALEASPSYPQGKGNVFFKDRRVYSIKRN